MRRASILILIFTLAAGAQTTRKKKKPAPKSLAVEQAPETFPIASLSVDGNHVYPAAQILKAAALTVGQKADRATFEAARDRLLATGAFASVGYHYTPATNGDGYAAVFDIKEEAQFYPFRFEDLPATDADLIAWLQQKDPLYQTKIPGTDVAIQHYTGWIKEYLLAHNFPEPLSGKLSQEYPPDLVVLFRPAVSRRAVAQVDFKGNKEIATTMLQSAIVSTAVGAGYTENRFRQFLNNTIRPLYEVQGRLRVAFGKLTTQPAKDVIGLAVTAEVAEGPVYKFGKLGVDGSDDLLRLIKAKSGTVANFDLINAARDAIDENYRNKGYLKVKSEAVRTMHDKELTVDVLFVSELGPLYTMSALNVVGLDIQSEPYLRKLWSIQPGQPFNIGYPDHFLSVVKEEGIFDNLGKTAAETKINEADHTVDVTLTFKGAPPVENKRRRDPQTGAPTEP